MEKEGWWIKFFKKIYKKSIESSIEEIGKGIGKTQEFLVKSPERQEIEEISGEIGFVMDIVLKNVLKDKWENLSGKTAKDTMREVSIIKPETSIKVVAKILQGEEEIVFVMNQKGTLLGEIAEYDLVKLLVPSEKIVTEIGLLGTYDKSYFGKKAEDVMRKQIMIVTPSTPIEKIAYLINKNSLIAVGVAKGSKIIGVVHARDLMRYVK